MKSTSNTPSKKHMALMLGMMSGFALLAILALLFVGEDASEAFVWVGVGASMIASCLLTIPVVNKKPTHLRKDL